MKKNAKAINELTGLLIHCLGLKSRAGGCLGPESWALSSNGLFSEARLTRIAEALLLRAQRNRTRKIVGLIYGELGFVPFQSHGVTDDFFEIGPGEYITYGTLRILAERVLKLLENKRTTSTRNQRSNRNGKK